MFDKLLSNLPLLLIPLGLLYLLGIGILIYHLIRFGHQPQDKKPYENILITLHRHWFVLVAQIIASILVGIIFSAILIIFPQVILLGVVFFMIWSYMLLYIITMYLLDVWIVTDHRIIDSEQQELFNHTVAELGLHSIQDISVQIAGVIPTFLDFGSLEVQTAAAMEKFFFKQIPHPEKVKDIIMDARNEFIKLHPSDVEVHEHP